MILDLKLFAKAKDLAGTDSLAVELPEGATVGDLRTQLHELYPAMSPFIHNLLISVGTDYAQDSQPLSPNVEVACFPPVSGG